MKKQFTLFTLCMSLQLFLYAQTTNIWYFGGNAGLDFTGGSPVALTNGMVNTFEGCATICDNSGALLFYTDGITVYCSNHSVMQNGTNLNSNSSSNQAAIIIPFPGNPDNYYIFTTYDDCAGPLSYSVVDMTQGSGLGAVTIKNVQLLASVAEKITAVKDANGVDYWVVVHESNDDQFYSYKVTATGISAPVVSTAGGILTTSNCLGGMKLNPQGTQLAVTLEGDYSFQLFDFDNSTGIISNGIILGPLISYTYSCEFSPSGHYLYGCMDPGIAMLYQFDVTLGSASAINASMVQIGTGSTNFNFGTLQNGPDGKIYVSRYGQNYLGAINNPESQGMASNYVDSAVFLAGKYNEYGLPNFLTSYFDVTTGIAENTYRDSFSVYPNPFTKELRINYAEFREKTELKIIDVFGKIVLSQQFLSPNIHLKTSSLPQGVYFVKLNSKVIKIIKTE